VSPDYSLHGHPLIAEILKYAGVSNATGKSHGNQNLYNVVYATFKALMMHKSLKEIAMKRGKKLLNLQRARRLGIYMAGEYYGHRCWHPQDKRAWQVGLQKINTKFTLTH
jgi:hypothetical protein